jgi:hypothetical protein
MKHTEKITPVAGALTALATLACCLPVGFAAAAATASVAAVVASYQSWFLGASVVLLALGGVQLAQARRTCPTRGNASVVILALSALVVALVIFFPQVIAGLLADWMPS